MPTSETVQALEQAADGLTYPSDTDSPWTAFAWPTAKGDPTGAAVRHWGKYKARAPVEEQAVDEFFALLVADQDWYGDEERATAAKYRALLDVVKHYLKGAKVVRVGGRKRAVYVVGTASEGGWAGLKTIAVET
jgi:Nuclease A inhibitor-like protein